MIRTIAARELRSLFGSPAAWVVLAVLQFTLAYLFLTQVDGYLALQPQLGRLANPPGLTEAVVAPTFGGAAVVLLMATPLFSMRLISEERRNRTLPLLLAAPVSMTEIVLGKFLGLLGLLGAIILLLAAMALSLYAGGKLDPGLLASNALGLALLAASFAALGLYVSSLTSHPLVAAVGSLGALLALWIVNQSTRDPDSVLSYLSLLRHFETFNRGVVAVADLAYFALFIATFLVLAIRRLDGERLRG